MSDYRVPMQQPERPVTAMFYMTEGDPHPHVFNGGGAEVEYVTVDGERYERVRERCEYCQDGKSFDGQVVMVCNHGTQRINYCPNCGSKVGDADGD